MAHLLARMQRGLEDLYRVATGLDVREFVIDAATRDRVAAGAVHGRVAREQLLVAEEEGELSMALFVDPAAVANLERHDPSRGLSDANAGDFLLAVEGVSHFVYAAVCAQAERSVSALELELQGEVDKYVTGILCHDDRQAAAAWRQRLFERFAFEPDLDHDERDRYRVANDNASRFVSSLERRFVARHCIADMLGELRRFYRLPLASKLEHIARAA